MTNNYWEEQDMSETILDFHEELMSKVELPKWITDIKCPFCNKKVPYRSIRNIQLCFNTRNFGDIAIEILCDECSKMDTLYLRLNCDSIDSFVKFLTSKLDLETLGAEPVLEQDMYKKQYNNVIEKMTNKTEN